MRSLEDILGGLKLSRSTEDELILAIAGANSDALRALAQYISELSGIKDVTPSDNAVCAVCQDDCDVNKVIGDVYTTVRHWLATLTVSMRARFFGA